MISIFAQIGLRVRAKSDAYYYPTPANITEEEAVLSDEEFANMLQEIDRFSEKFSRRHAKQAQLISSK